MTIKPLPLETTAKYGWTHKATVDYTDLTGTAGTTKTIQLFPTGTGTVAAGMVALGAAIRIRTNFDGGATSELTIQLGDGGDTDRLLVAKSIHEDGTEIPFFVSNAATQPHAYLAADSIDALFTATGANLTELTQGKVDIYLAIGSLTELDAV